MRKLIVALVAIAMVAVASSDAGARVMHVYTCIGPDGKTAGLSIDAPEASGWQILDAPGVGIDSRDMCPIANGFQFHLLFGHLAVGAGVWTRWTAADGTNLVGVSVAYTASSDLAPNPYNHPARGAGTVQLRLATDQELISAVNSPLASYAGVGGAPPLVRTVRPSRFFSIGYVCVLDCALREDGGYLRVLEARFDVDDSTSPVGGVIGSAADAQVWSGALHLRLNASDQGTGVARTVLLVDSAAAIEFPLMAGSCRDVGSDPNVREYSVPQPCPRQVDDRALDVDTAALPQGRHEVQIAVEDAAGNRTTVFGPVMRTIAANGPIGPGSDLSLRGPANGEGASDQARLTAHWGRRKQRSRLVSRFGRKHVVYGRLVGSDGAPIANAALDVVSRTTAVNARELAKRNGPVTRADGRWSMTLPRAVSSRDVAFRYRSHAGDTVATAIASVRLRVRAGLWMTIRPRVARRGQAIRFSGRLLGGPLPPGGKQVVLVARGSKGPWLRFNVVRTDAAGRFRATYRFQQTGLVR